MRKPDHKEQKPAAKKSCFALWHSIHDVDFDGVENDISEITHEPVTPVLGNIEPVWTDA